MRELQLSDYWCPVVLAYKNMLSVVQFHVYLYSIVVSSILANKFVIPQSMLENHYLYKVEQSHFNKGNEENINISCVVVIRCEAGKILKVHS